MDELSRLWAERRPECPPLADELKSAYPDRWVRFHSLPESKRYADTEDEYAILLDRYNTVLDGLFAGQDVHVITADWSHETSEPPAHPGHWLTLRTEPDPEFLTYTHLYARRVRWRRGSLDDLLRDVADDLTAGVMITDPELRRIHHPYDGGQDVILATTAERDLLRERHADWLSAHPLGL